jgi:predicted nuclease of predicted toxin-antitoxin system
MRFLADMGISPIVIDFLQRLGHRATHLHQEGLDRLGDAEILQKARTEGSILLTHDLDFGDLLAAHGADLPSVVIFRLRNMRPERVNRHLLGVISQHAKELENGAIVVVSEGQARIRNLPLKNGR